MFIYKYTPASEKVKRACPVPIGSSMSNPCMAFSARKNGENRTFQRKNAVFFGFQLAFRGKSDIVFDTTYCGVEQR